VIAQVVAFGAPQPGAHEAVAMIQRLGLPMAIASSSPRRLIDTVCSRIGIDIGIRCSATDEAQGKPAPDVYLTAARRLGVDPGHCLAIEDSPAGVRSAMAAGMRCIAVPDPLVGDNPGFTAADLRLDSLIDLDEAALRSLGWDA
jgi:beta-phosphoglucomutase-like phosphatase (HAD superfamily)